MKRTSVAKTGIDGIANWTWMSGARFVGKKALPATRLGITRAKSIHAPGAMTKDRATAAAPAKRPAKTRRPAPARQAA